MNKPCRDDIFQKLAHPLEEVRQRTLKSIYNKLSRGLVQIDAFVNDINFVRSLLEWFNNENHSSSDLVLDILKRLAEHPQGKRQLISIGAVEFLNDMRADCDKDIEKMVNEILSILQVQPIALNETYKEEEEEGITVNYSSRIVTWAFDAQTPKPSIGYFDDSHSIAGDVTDAHALQDVVDFGENDAFKVLYFGTIALVRNDRQVLDKVITSLSSNEVQIVTGAMEFFHEVILKDFPPEVFLQRPNIVKNLFTIIMAGEISLLPTACDCLVFLCQSLQARIQQVHDPNMFCKKDVLKSVPNQLNNNSTVNSARLVGSTLSNVTDSYNDSSIPPVGSMSVPCFSMEVANVCLSQFIGMQPRETYPSLFAALNCSVDLLADCQPTTRKACLRTRELLNKFKELIEKWIRMMNRYSQQQQTSVPFTRHIWIGLMLPFIRFLSVLLDPQYALTYLNEMARCELILAMTDEPFRQAFPREADIVTSFVHVFHLDSFTAVRILDNVKTAMLSLVAFMNYEDNDDDAGDEKRTIKEKGSSKRMKLAMQALAALEFVNHVDFVQQFIQFYSDLCSISSPFDSTNDIFTDGVAILNQLFSHYHLSITRAAFGKCLDLVKASLNVKVAVNPHAVEHYKVRFLLQMDVMREIAQFGLGHQQKEIREVASAILVHLWESRLYLGNEDWMRLMQLSAQLLPVYQMHLTNDWVTNSLSNHILHLSLHPSTEIKSSFPQWCEIVCPDQAATKAGADVLYLAHNSIRLSLHKDEAVREQAVQNLLYLLVGQMDSESRLPIVETESMQQQARNWSNWLLVDDDPIILNISSGSHESTSWNARKQCESLRKVMDILMNDALDPHVRRSAAEQIAIFIQQRELLSFFIHNNGVEVCQRLIHRCILRDNILLSAIIKPLVLLLRLIVQHDSHSRSLLSKNVDFILNVIRAGLHLFYDKAVKREVACLLCLCAYNGVIEQQLNGGVIGVPHCVITNLRMPFVCSVVDPISPHQIPRSDPQNLISSSDSCQRALRIRWTIARLGDLHQICDKPIQLDRDRFHLDMRLNEIDIELLEETVPSLQLAHLLEELDKAANHDGVLSVSLSLLTLLHSWPSTSVLPCMANIRWFHSLERFLYLQPSCSADYRLLDQLLVLLTSYLHHLLHHSHSLEHLSSFLSWLAGVLLREFSPILLCFMRGESLFGQTDSARLVASKEGVLKRVRRLFALIIRSLDVVDTKSREVWWSLLVDVVQRCDQILLVHLKTPFANLALICSVSSILAHATHLTTWMNSREELTIKLIEHQLDFLNKVQECRGSLSVSFMGTGIVYYLLMSLAHLADFQSSKPALLSKHEDTWFLRPSWLLPLIHYRSIEIRALALHLSSLLCEDEVTCARLCSLSRRDNKSWDSDLWILALTSLCDIDEAALVRTQAACLLVTLTQRSLPIAATHLTALPMSTCFPVAMTTRNHINQPVLTAGLEALKHLLHEYQLLRVAGTILTNFYPFPFIYSDTMANANNSSITGDVSASSSSSSTVVAILTAMLSADSPTLAFNPSVPDVVGTPVLIVAMCRLLYNLCHHLPEEMLHQLETLKLNTLLMNLIDTEVLQTLLSLSAQSVKSHNLCNQVITACSESLSVVTCLASLSSDFRFLLLSDDRFLLKLVLLIDLKGSNMKLYELWKSVFLLLICLLEPDPGLKCCMALLSTIAARLDVLFHLIANLLKTVRNFQNDQHSLQQRSLILSVAKSSLQLLSILLTRDLPRRPGETVAATKIFKSKCLKNPIVILIRNFQIKNHQTQTDFEVVNSTNVDGLVALVEQLLTLKDLLDTKMAVSSSRDPICSLQSALWNVLKCLLAISDYAKESAINGGFVEGESTRLKLLVSRLCLGPGLPTMMDVATNSQKDDSSLNLLRQISFSLTLLQNLTFMHSNAKLITVSSSIPQILHRVWPIALWHHQSPLPTGGGGGGAGGAPQDSCFCSLLWLLINVTAHCDKGALAMLSSLTMNPEGTGLINTPSGPPCPPSLALTSSSLSTSSLLQALIQLMQGCDCVSVQPLPAKISAYSFVIVNAGFYLLANVALSLSARTALIKTKFLDNFSRLNPKSLLKSKSGIALCGFWLQLLTNLSFYEDGQRLIMKIPDLLELLTTFANNGNYNLRKLALLTLRGLCSNSQLKIRLLSAESHVLTCFANQLTTKEEHLCFITLSAIKFLLYNNQKARVLLRSEDFLRKAMILWREANDSASKDLLEDVHSILLTLQE